MLSVIIPLAPKEELTTLLQDLRTLPDHSEVLFAAACAQDCCCSVSDIPCLPVRFVASSGGRAGCLNAGAKEARGKFLWFLHADSHFDGNAIISLVSSMEKHPGALLFFDLAYGRNSLPFMRLNEWGADFRSRILRNPFGDQGLCIGKEQFDRLGGFPSDVPYGEDHLFVRKAIRSKIPVVPVNAPLYTSPRKYEKNGWLGTTATHLYLWRKQACQDYFRHWRSNDESWYY